MEISREYNEVPAISKYYDQLYSGGSHWMGNFLKQKKKEEKGISGGKAL